MLRLTDGSGASALRTPRLERAIGVIYRPETERQSHYFLARIASQFDAVIHLDETRAVAPLERTAGWEFGEPSETLSLGGLVSAGPAVALDVLRPTLLRWRREDGARDREGPYPMVASS